MAFLVQNFLGRLSACDRESLNPSPPHVVGHKAGVKQPSLNKYTCLVPIQLLLVQMAATYAHDGHYWHFYRSVCGWNVWQYPAYTIRVLGRM